MNRTNTEAQWLGAWKDGPDKPLGLSWVKKMKILGIVFGTVNVDQDNWEPRVSKLEKSVSQWQSRSLSLIGKVLILNILGLSKLLFVFSILSPHDGFSIELTRLSGLFCGARESRQSTVSP